MAWSAVLDWLASDFCASALRVEGGYSHPGLLCFAAYEAVLPLCPWWCASGVTKLSTKKRKVYTGRRHNGSLCTQKQRGLPNCLCMQATQLKAAPVITTRVTPLAVCKQVSWGAWGMKSYCILLQNNGIMKLGARAILAYAAHLPCLAEQTYRAL